MKARGTLRRSPMNFTKYGRQNAKAKLCSVFLVPLSIVFLLILYNLVELKKDENQQNVKIRQPIQHKKPTNLLMAHLDTSENANKINIDQMTYHETIGNFKSNFRNIIYIHSRLS